MNLEIFNGKDKKKREKNCISQKPSREHKFYIKYTSITYIYPNQLRSRQKMKINTIFYTSMLLTALTTVCMQQSPCDKNKSDEQNKLNDQLRKAIEKKDFESMESILEKGANPNSILALHDVVIGANTCAITRTSSAMDQLEKKYLSAIELLLKHKANPLLCNLQGNNALKISFGLSKKIIVDTCFVEAVKDMNIEKANFFLFHKADVNYKSSHDRHYPIHWAIKRSYKYPNTYADAIKHLNRLSIDTEACIHTNEDVVVCLTCKGRAIRMAHDNLQKEADFHEKKRLIMLKLLIEAGAQPTLTNINKHNAFTLVGKYPYPIDVLKILCPRGNAIQCYDGRDMNVLTAALAWKNLDLLDFLLQDGRINPNEVDPRGHLPIVDAMTVYHYPPIVNRLVADQRVDLNRTDSAGRSFFSCAETAGFNVLATAPIMNMHHDLDSQKNSDTTNKLAAAMEACKISC